MYMYKYRKMGRYMYISFRTSSEQSTGMMYVTQSLWVVSMGKKIRCLGCMFQPVSNIHVCEGGLGGCELDDMDLLCTLECKHVYSLSGHKHGGKLAAQTWLEQEGLSKSRSKSSSTRDSLEIRYQSSNRGKTTDRHCMPPRTLPPYATLHEV